MGEGAILRKTYKAGQLFENCSFFPNGCSELVSSDSAKKQYHRRLPQRGRGEVGRPLPEAVSPETDSQFMHESCSCLSAGCPFASQDRPKCLQCVLVRGWCTSGPDNGASQDGPKRLPCVPGWSRMPSVWRLQDGASRGHTVVRPRTVPDAFRACRLENGTSCGPDNGASQDRLRCIPRVPP